MRPRARQLLIVGVSLTYVLLLSSGFVAVKFAIKSSPPLTLSVARFVVASSIIAAIIKWLGLKWPTTIRAWVRLSFLGVLQVLLPTAFVNIAMKNVSVGTCAIVFATNPLVLTLVAPRLLGERLTLRRGLGVLFGFGGVSLVMLARMGRGRDTAIGILCVALAVCSLVSATILYKRIPPREPLIVVSGVQLVVSSVFLFLPAMIFDHPFSAKLDANLFASLFYLVFAVNVGASLLWYWLLARGEASVASAYLFLSPIFGIIFGSVLFSETFGLREAVGLLAVCAGIMLIRPPPTKAPAVVVAVPK